MKLRLKYFLSTIFFFTSLLISIEVKAFTFSDIQIPSSSLLSSVGDAFSNSWSNITSYIGDAIYNVFYDNNINKETIKEIKKESNISIPVSTEKKEIDTNKITKTNDQIVAKYFIGPKGDKGDKGERGSKGERGERGSSIDTSSFISHNLFYRQVDDIYNSVNKSDNKLSDRIDLLESSTLTSYTESDPTISSWAKASNKPTYTASEVGLGNVPNLLFSGSNTGDETNLSIKTKLGVASISSDGYLSSTDWNIFNSKQNALGFTPYNSTNPNNFISDGNTGWDNSYGFITGYTESDPIYTSWNKSTGISIKENQISDLKSYLTSYTETDPLYSISSWYSTLNNSSNWNTAYSWGNHANAGYVIGNPWASMGYITDGNTGWDNSYGFITGYTESDPTIPSWAKASIKPTYTASEVGLGNVTNESKETMFTNPTFTGNVSFGNINMNGNIIPSLDNTYTLGDASHVWKDIFVGPGSIYVDGQKVLQTNDEKSVVVSSDIDQNLILKTTGTGNIELNPVGSGSILLKDNVTLSGGKVIRTSDLSSLIFSDGISTPKITTNVLNGGLEITPNGTGNTYITSGYFGIRNTAPTELLSIGTSGTIGGTLSLAGGTSGKAIVQTSAIAGNPTLTLPTTTGTLALTSDISTSLSEYLKLDQATPQTTVGTFTFPKVVATTDLTSPLLIGGSAVGSVLQLKGTTGNGTLTSPAIQAKVGNNGATTALTVLNNGNVGIGTTTPTYKLEVRGTATADAVRSAMGFDIYQVPDPATPTGVVSAGGSVDTGAHWYLVTYTTATGETHYTATASQITTTAGNNTVTLTIPVSTDPRVTGRKIYRTKVGEAVYQDYLLTTIANNTDTTYVDTLADSSLTGSSGASYFRLNTTSKNITVNGTTALTLDSKGTIAGFNAGRTLATGGRYTIFGKNAGVNLTTGTDANLFGESAGANLTTGSSNTLLGYNTGLMLTSGNNNVAVGLDALLYAGTGSSSNTVVGVYAGAGVSGTSLYTSNAIFGYYSGYSLTTGSYNTALGTQSLYYNTTGANNTALGYNSGRYIADGTTGRTIGNNGLYLGYNSKASADGTDNEIVIGYNAIGNGSNTVTLGNTSITKHIFGSGNVGIGIATPAKKLSIVDATDGSLYIRKNTTTTGDYSEILGAVSTADIYNSAIRTYRDGRLGFFTNNVTGAAYADLTESMTILKTGLVGIGTINPSYRLDVGNSSVSGVVAQFTNSTGYCTINPTTTSLSCSSDISLKKNIYTLEQQEFILNNNIPTQSSTLSKLLSLTPVTYNWNSELDTDSKHIGFIAQEMEQVFPDLVSTDPISSLKSISYGNLTPYIIKSIQEMNLQITDIGDISNPNTWRDSIIAWLGNIANGIESIYTKKVNTEELCVGGVCVTSEQFLRMVENANIDSVVNKVDVTTVDNTNNDNKSITTERGSTSIEAEDQNINNEETTNTNQDLISGTNVGGNIENSFESVETSI